MVYLVTGSYGRNQEGGVRYVKRNLSKRSEIFQYESANVIPDSIIFQERPIEECRYYSDPDTRCLPDDIHLIRTDVKEGYVAKIYKIRGNDDVVLFEIFVSYDFDRFAEGTIRSYDLLNETRIEEFLVVDETEKFTVICDTYDYKIHIIETSQIGKPYIESYCKDFVGINCLVVYLRDMTLDDYTFDAPGYIEELRAFLSKKYYMMKRELELLYHVFKDRKQLAKISLSMPHGQELKEIVMADSDNEEIYDKQEELSRFKEFLEKNELLIDEETIDKTFKVRGFPKHKK